MNIRQMLSSLHAECKVFIWTIECMKILQFLEIVCAIDFFSISENNVYTDIMARFRIPQRENLTIIDVLYPVLIQHIP